MDQVNILTPRKALNKAYLKVKPNRTQIESFKTHLIQLLDGINEHESEEFHKNLVSHFLKNTYYLNQFFINTKDREDLAIYNGKDGNNSVGVIIETKNPVNKAEMLTKDNLNRKALHELVLYYLRERITGNNLEVKYLIATNIYEWFIFDATVFEKLFVKNKKLVQQFTDFEEKRLSGFDTNFFYKEIAAPFVEKVKNEITFTWFDIRAIEKPLRDNIKNNDSKLIAYYKIFSPEHLLKLPFVNDSNTLDKGFYNELLHIIGLEETKSGSKKLIGRKEEGKRDAGSLIENAITILKAEDCLSNIDRLKYGTTKDEQLYNVALELVITWTNRILFLKLLEGQLVQYHNGDKAYRFLNAEQIPGYDALNKLFFQVLAIKEEERNEQVKKQFARIPYLNSSLFETNELEKQTIRISNLEDEFTLPILNSTVLTSSSGKRIKGKKSALHYLFEFLNAYDFSNESKEEIQEENKTLINASVLGLIFEKINGYKDGSFFTPGFITMYMSRETIRRAIVQKFNDTWGWDCNNFEELREDLFEEIRNGNKGRETVRVEANNIVNSLRICDPAVGSGHFLVSALNELITIKSELKILTDRNGQPLNDYTVDIANDELVITNLDDELFDYKPTHKESQRVQETLFHEKQTIIESCLFGVDINPNSVKICRLRLWIELLKNAYYKSGTEELETLPNIDINIKQGNSLISRYALDADIKKALKNSKWNIESYRLAVQTYREAKSKEVKHEMQRLIDAIKNDFESEIAANDKRIVSLSKLKGELYYLNSQKGLFEMTRAEKSRYNKRLKELTPKIAKLETELEEIKNNKIYENAFEWRFEFPEVLNDDGDFVGFDVVIGNPPYIPLEDFGSSTKQFFKSNYDLVERKYETSVLFIILGLRLLKRDSILSYIAPITWQTGENYSNFRNKLFSDWGIYRIVNLPFDIFSDAFVDTAIYILGNSKRGHYDIYSFKKNEYHNKLLDIKFTKIKSSLILRPKHKIILNPLVFEIIQRLGEDKFEKLGDISISTQGLSPSRFSKVEEIKTDFTFPYLKSGNVYNYVLQIEETYNTTLRGLETLIPYYQEGEKILIRRLINRQDRLSVGYTDKRLVFKKDINPFIIIDQRFHTKYVLALLASKFVSYFYVNVSAIALKDDFRQTTLGELREILIPIVSDSTQTKFIQLVDNILYSKSMSISANTINLEADIDLMVYKLYELTWEEVKVVDPDFEMSKEAYEEYKI